MLLGNHRIQVDEPERGRHLVQVSLAHGGDHAVDHRVGERHRVLDPASKVRLEVGGDIDVPGAQQRAVGRHVVERHDHRRFEAR
jgi:hypothetical protein